MSLPKAMLMPVGCASAKGYVGVSGLYLRPWISVLYDVPRAMLESMVLQQVEVILKSVTILP